MICQLINAYDMPTRRKRGQAMRPRGEACAGDPRRYCAQSLLGNGKLVRRRRLLMGAADRNVSRLS